MVRAMRSLLMIASPVIPNSPLPAPSREIDDVVEELRRLCHTTGLRLAIRVGRLVVERLYGGDAGLWRARGPKDVSLRKLQTHPRLPFHASTLSKSVSIYVLSNRRADLVEARHLCPSHLHEVLALPRDLQDQLIDDAERERWSVARLRSEVRLVRAHSSARGRPGRPRLPSFVKSVHRLREDVNRRALLSDSDALTALGMDETRGLLDTTRRLCQQAEALTRMLTSHLNTLERGALASPPTDGDRAHRAPRVVPLGVSTSKRAVLELPPSRPENELRL
jgi:hypothetical protein